MSSKLVYFVKGDGCSGVALQGDRGPSGTRGLKGTSGDKGPVGSRGPAGKRGAEGHECPPGNIGKMGPVEGDIGAHGEKCDNLLCMSFMYVKIKTRWLPLQEGTESPI